MLFFNIKNKMHYMHVSIAPIWASMQLCLAQSIHVPKWARNHIWIKWLNEISYFDYVIIAKETKHKYANAQGMAAYLPGKWLSMLINKNIVSVGVRQSNVCRPLRIHIGFGC